MTLACGTCTSEERPGVIAALDAEFVTGRGRTLSLALRYPQLFTQAALANLHVLRDGADIVACAIARPFLWGRGERTWRGAMIGMVYTAPPQRGQGLGGRLLTALVATLRDAGFDIAVLWSGLDGYYERLGWQRGDCGIYGSLRSTGVADAPAPTDGPTEVSRIAEICRAASPLVRDADAWQTLPLPVTQRRVVATTQGYALYGTLAGHTYLYEMHGPAQDYPELWRRCSAGAQCIHVNVEQFGAAYRWLNRHTRIQWRPQRLTFWYPLTRQARRLALASWYVPWFDRI